MVFVAAKGLQTVFWLLLIYPHILDHRNLFTLSIVIFSAGGALEAVSQLLILGMYSNRVKVNYIIMAGFSCAGAVILNLFGSDLRFLLAFLSLQGVLFFLYPAYVLWMNRIGSPLQKLMGLMYMFIIVVFMIRAGVFISEHNLERVIIERIIALFYIAAYLFIFLGSAGFMLLLREQSYIELERVATYDELTGILNRRSFMLRSRSLIAEVAGEGQPYSFLLLDIDHFKNVNDTYGHDAGDKVLRNFTAAMERVLGREDLFGRFGGEEFAVLLPRAGEAASGEIAERLRTSILEADVNGMQINYTVSIGVVTVIPTERISLNTLFKICDKALYQAKKHGRNCVMRVMVQY